MPLKKPLIVAKYLVKNYLINPILKKFKKILLAILVIIIISVATVAIAMLVMPSEGGGGKEAGKSNRDLRGLLARLGLTKEKIISILSGLLTFSFLFDIMRGRRVLPVMEEAEYELLLAQPISMGEYMLGRELFQSVQLGAMGAFYLGALPLIYDLSGGNTLKTLLFPLSATLLFIYMGVLTVLSPLLNISLPRHRGLIRALATLYLALGLAHSMAVSQPSPLLVAPFFFPVASIVYCATLSDPVTVVVAYHALTASAIFVLSFVNYKLSSRLYPENIVPVSEIYRIKAGERKVSFTLYASTPQGALTRLLIYRALADKKSRATVVAALLSALALGYVVRAVVLPFLSATPESISEFTSFLVPFIAAEATSVLSGLTLSVDLSPLWVYRVYLLDREALSGRLILKHSIYYGLVFLAVAVFKASLTGDPSELGYFLFMLPVAALISGLSLLILVYLASKRRIVKVAPTGRYLLEDVANAVVFVLDFVLIIAFSALYELVGSPITALVFCCIATPIAYTVFSRILGELLNTVDIVS